MTDLNKERELELFNAFVAKELPELFEKHSNGNYFSKIIYDSMLGAWLGAKAQAVPDTHVLIEKKDIENWYLDESEYMWFEADGIDGYLEDIDIGEVVEVQRKEYVVTNNNPVFAAKPWDDNGNCADTWEFFESKDEAEKAAAHCKSMFEASESGAEE